MPVFEDAPTPTAALGRLVEGNERFRTQGPSISHGWTSYRDIVDQRPFAIVLGCSDSRTPVEILFDQGFGDLFVVRVAGNIVAPSLVGSIEFAASQFGSRLVVVMGHTRCGAIYATLDTLRSGMGPDSRNIAAITERIAPHVAGLISVVDPVDLAREATRANIRASVDHLRHGSDLLEALVLSGRLAIVGAEYELETGVVNFLDHLPE